MKRYNLKFWRMRQGLTQAEMGEKLGISGGHYKGIENGVYDPSKKIIDQFCEHFLPDAPDVEILQTLRTLFAKEGEKK